MTPTDAFLKDFPTLVGPFDDEVMSDEELQLAIALMDSGVFTGEFPSELLTSLFRLPPGANPAI